MKFVSKGEEKVAKCIPPKDRDTSREKKPKPLSKQEIRGMGEDGQTEDIKECIKANTEEREKKIK